MVITAVSDDHESGGVRSPLRSRAKDRLAHQARTATTARCIL